MGNKTIYVKNEQLWEKAKSIAGKAGLSGLIEQALSGYVAEREREQQGLVRFYLNVEEVGGFKSRIGFDGKKLGSFQKSDFMLIVSVYQTKAGKFILTNDDPDGTANDYRLFDSLDELTHDSLFEQLGPDESGEFAEQLANELGTTITQWID
jgi:hypothetical protein